MASFPNQETVIREVGKAYDQIKKLRALLQFKPRKIGDDALGMNELAQPLFEEALQGLNHSLHIMKSGTHKMEMKHEIIDADPSGASGSISQGSILFDDFDRGIVNGRGKRRRTEDNSWTCTTTVPYDDGYQWRKYGEKKISGTNSSRSYFRCTFKEEQGCQAKKLVQETTNNKHPPTLFHVKYTNKHTCNSQIPPPIQELQSDVVYEQIIKRNICMAHHNMPPNYYNSADDDDGLREALSSHCVVQRSGEWDIDALIMELDASDAGDASFLLT